MSPAPLVECVPNFSEGRDRGIIEAIVSAMAGVTGTHVLDVSSGATANRTVVTIAGSPEAVLESAFRGVAVATHQIDMRDQRGVHPRIGAADVVPLVPIRGIGMDVVVALATRLSHRIGDELGVPVYRYGRAAAPGRPTRLAALRRGQLDGLRERFEAGRLLPDDGPQRWSPRIARTGATAVGARGYLVAMNATLTTADIPLARSIARAIRTRGPAKRDADGSVLRDSHGIPVREVGPFPGVRAIGWGIEEYDRSQVSMNLVQPAALSVHALLCELDRLARSGGAGVQGCELIGLIPSAVLAEVGRDAGATGDALDAGLRRLGLDHLKPCTVDDVVLERRLQAVGLLST
jgi:glutamate formiminotransferase/formiminotetrahydrofolate cyclodeaminase